MSRTLEAPRPLRLFFALWPDDAARARLAALASDFAAYAGGRAMPAEKIHLTLAFLGSVAPGRLSLLAPIAQAIEATPFELYLDRTGSFRRARVAWAGADAMPPELVRLQADLSENLRANGFALEDRPFAPHVTLARKIERALPRAAIPAVAWPVRAFCLVESETGTGRYTTRATWPLG